MIRDFDVRETTVSWVYNDKLIKIEEYEIGDAKYFKKEELVIVFYYDKNDINPYMIGYNNDGTKRFSFKSKDELGVDSFTNQPGYTNIPLIGWVREEDGITDYYFTVDPQDGSLDRYGRAY